MFDHQMISSTLEQLQVLDLATSNVGVIAIIGHSYGLVMGLLYT